MTDSALFMIEEYNLDGFRHDATKHIPTLFWRTLTNKIKTKFPNKFIYQIGETFGSRELIGSYVQTGQLDGQFDFNLYFDSRNVFAKDNSNFNDLHSSLMQSFKYYGDHSLMGNITGNHDIPRFISYASNGLSFNEDEKEAGWSREVKILDTLGYNRLRMLTAFITTIPGIPIIYYGDEIGLVGAGDPDNRKKMIFNDLNNFQNKTKENLKKLLDLRNNRMSLIYGGFNLIDVTSDLYIYERNYFEEKSIVIFNKSDEIKEVTINNLEEYNINFNSKSDKNIVKIKPYNFEILTNKEK
jgi:glycosidase